MTDIRNAAEAVAKDMERLDGWLKLRGGIGLTPQEVEHIAALREALAAPVVPQSATGGAQYLHQELTALLEKCRVGYVMSKGTNRRLGTAVRISEALAAAVAAAPKPKEQT